MSSSSQPPFSRPPPEYASASASHSKKPTAPVYGATDGSDDPRKPLLNQQPGEGLGPRDAWNEDGEAEDDFLIGVSLSQSSQDIRHEFVRKVYTVLLCQILLTTAIGAGMCTETVATWTFKHHGLFMLPMFGAFASMLLCFWKATSTPLNTIFLALFTVCEAVTVGWVMPAYNPDTILKALLLTTFVFLGLTLFTFQTKYDIMSWYPYLMSALIGFAVVSFASIFFPFSSGFDLGMALFGCLLFSAWIIFDTQMILKTLHPDQWVLAAISLYLDFLNLFLQILRVLSDIQDR
ncbi:Bxi1p [Sporobolomyces salmoneus]|uniref:Bxi1p n=1 Tax=Sporobolomyces salmoneus TaxID=183962 RepID=UPI0031713138